MTPETEFAGITHKAKRWQREITLYRGEEIVGVGTIESLAEERGVSCKYMEWLTTPTAARRANGSPDHLIAVRTD